MRYIHIIYICVYVCVRRIWIKKLSRILIWHKICNLDTEKSINSCYIFHLSAFPSYISIYSFLPLIENTLFWNTQRSLSKINNTLGHKESIKFHKRNNYKLCHVRAVPCSRITYYEGENDLQINLGIQIHSHQNSSWIFWEIL